MNGKRVLRYTLLVTAAIVMGITSGLVLATLRAIGQEDRHTEESNQRISEELYGPPLLNEQEKPISGYPF